MLTALGLDGNNYEYTGHSAAYDVLGQRHGYNSSRQEGIIEIVTVLEKDHISKVPRKAWFFGRTGIILI